MKTLALSFLVAISSFPNDAQAALVSKANTCEALLLNAGMDHTIGVESRASTTEALKNLREFRTQALNTPRAVEPSSRAVETDSTKASKRAVQRVAERIRGIEHDGGNRSSDAQKQTLIAGKTLEADESATGREKIQDHLAQLLRDLAEIDRANDVILRIKTETSEKAYPLRDAVQFMILAVHGIATSQMIESGAAFGASVYQGSPHPDLLSATLLLYPFIRSPEEIHAYFKNLDLRFEKRAQDILKEIQSSSRSEPYWFFWSQDYELPETLFRDLWFNHRFETREVQTLEALNQKTRTKKLLDRLTRTPVTAAERNLLKKTVFVSYDQLLQYDPESNDYSLTYVVRVSDERPQYPKREKESLLDRMKVGAPKLAPIHVPGQ